MGSPKKPRKKYTPPKHPWLRERINEEKEVVEKYGLKNKKEIWKSKSMLRNFKEQAKNLIPRQDAQSRKEEKELLARLSRLNLVGKDAKLDEVLTITLEDILNRRLQTILHKKKLAKTIKQARQFITHNHVFVKGKKVTIPSYLVLSEEEGGITFDVKSTLANVEHPERVNHEVQVKPGKIQEKGKEPAQ